MKKFRVVSLVLVFVLLLSMLAGCSKPATPANQSSSSSGGESTPSKDATDAKDVKVVFIPKLTGNMFFEFANDGAQQIGKDVGFEVKYDGSPEASVANQVQIINSAVNQGANAIAISSLSPDGLN